MSKINLERGEFMTNFYSANGINFTNPRDKTAINVTYNGLLAKSGANTIFELLFFYY